MLREDIKEFINSIDKNINNVAATKYVDSNQMRNLYDVGIINFGENRVDSFLRKYEELKDLKIIWHFIGHLQRNKAKDVINKIEYLHSLDSLKLAKIINDNRITPLKCFIEVSINLEETKNGVDYRMIDEFVEELKQFRNIEIVGLMMMSVKYSSKEELINQFSLLSKMKNEINKKHNLNIKYLSMGMSDDYKEAIKCGATHIRLGRILWKI